MTLDDLAGYQVERRQPLKTTVNKLQMMSTPPPGSGALISLALKIMEKFKWTPENQYKDQDLLYHNMIEALKYAYAPQTFMGDPNFTKNTDEVRNNGTHSLASVFKVQSAKKFEFLIVQIITKSEHIHNLRLRVLNLI